MPWRTQITATDMYREVSESYIAITSERVCSIVAVTDLRAKELESWQSSKKNKKIERELLRLGGRRHEIQTYAFRISLRRSHILGIPRCTALSLSLSLLHRRPPPCHSGYRLDSPRTCLAQRSDCRRSRKEPRHARNCHVTVG